MYWVFKAVLKPLLKALYRIRVEGLENVPKKGPAILAANHLSFLDSFFIPLVVKRRKVTYLAKADYFKKWKTAWFFKSAGQISCERGGGDKSQQSLEIALDVLKERKLLGIYPEGTRSPDGYLYRGRTGVARLALASGVPVVPVGLVGTDKVMPKSAKIPRLWGRVEVVVRFGEPIDFSRYAGKQKDRMALASGVPVIPVGLVGTDKVMPKSAKIPRLWGRVEVVVRFGEPIDFSRYAGKQKDRMALRSVTDEIVYEIMQLSGQEYRDEYASKTPSEPMPEPARSIYVDQIDLSEETLAG